MSRQAKGVSKFSIGAVQKEHFAVTKLTLVEENLLNLIAEIVVQKTLQICHKESIEIPALQQRRSEPT